MSVPTPFWGRNDETNKARGTAQAALIILEKMDKVASDPKHTKVDITATVEALMALDWNRRAVACMGSGSYNKTMQKLRQSKLPKQAYQDLVNLLKTSWADETNVLPDLWELWRALLVEFHLHDHAPISTWSALIENLQSEGIQSPAQLTDLTLEQVRAKYRMGAIPDMPQILWQAANRQCRALVPTQTLNRSGPSNVETLLGQIRAKNIDDCGIAQARKALGIRIGIPANYDKLTPGNKTKWLLNCTAPTLLIDEFIEKGRELNVLRATQGPLRPVASGIKSYANFCAARNRPWFPPTETSVKEWSTSFNPGRSYQNYLRHLQKACFLLDQPTPWLTQAVKTLAAGLENAQDKSFIFPNFIQSPDLITMLRHIKLDTELGQLCYMAYLFSLRVPSEALTARRAFADDPLLGFVPQEDKALMGVRSYKQTDILVLKFAFRKNLRNGCILKRPCICSEKNPLARLLCPPHTLWPLIKQRVDTGDLLFPNFTAHKFNLALKALMEDLRFDRAREYSSRAFRRGATQEIKDTGSTLAVIITSGGWTAAGYKSYLDLQMDEALNISALLIESMDSDSDETDDEPQTTIDRLRKRWRHIPKEVVPDSKSKRPIQAQTDSKSKK